MQQKRILFSVFFFTVEFFLPGYNMHSFIFGWPLLSCRELYENKNL